MGFTVRWRDFLPEELKRDDRKVPRWKPRYWLEKLFPDFTGSSRDYCVVGFWITVIGVSVTHLMLLRMAYDAPQASAEGEVEEPMEEELAYAEPSAPSGRLDSTFYNATAASPGQATSLGEIAEWLRRQDAAKSLLFRILDGDFFYSAEVATGRSLTDFDRQWDLLENVDFTQMRALRRWTDSIHIEAPYFPEDDARGVAWKALIRLIKEESVWKLEHIHVSPA